MKLKITLALFSLCFGINSIASTIDCFDSMERKQFVIKSYEGNSGAKVYFGVGGESHEVYVLSNSAGEVETYSKVYSNYVNPASVRMIEYKSNDSGLSIARDGLVYTCKRQD